MMNITPDELPEEGTPIDFPPIAMIGPVRFIEEGKNIFASLLTGETYTGLCKVVDPFTVTIGDSPESP